MSSPNKESNMSQMVWQSQPVEAPSISLEFVRLQVEKLRAKFWHAYYAMVAVSILCMVPVGITFYIEYPSIPELIVMRLSGVLVMIAAVYLTYQVRRRAKASSTQDGEKTLPGVESYRVELQRHRDFQYGTWPNILKVLGPAMLILFFGGIVYDTRPNKLLRYGLMSLWLFFGMLWVRWHSRRKAQQFQRELDALATMNK